VRAVVAGSSGSAAGMQFIYRGPSRGTAPLASGELRRQIGLKLRAQDTCNVVYVMWRIAPTSGIHVQVKSNPGRQKRHEECRDRGYQTIRPESRRPVPDVRPGESHSLDGFIDGGRLRVLADGVLAWEGTLPDEALDFTGPAGLRSDNGEFEVEFRASFDED
jgi:hypothetical protein